MANEPKRKLVLAWVDRDGFELTGGYRDRLMQVPETRATLQAKAVRWGDNTPKMLERLYAHIVAEQQNHLWMGWFSLPESNSMMDTARTMAMNAYQTAVSRAVTKDAQERRR